MLNSPLPEVMVIYNRDCPVRRAIACNRLPLHREEEKHRIPAATNSRPKGISQKNCRLETLRSTKAANPEKSLTKEVKEMGTKLKKAFDVIMQVATLGERMSVSIKAGIPSATAGSIPDDAKHLLLMRQAVDEVFDHASDPAIKAKKQNVLAALR